MQEFHSIGARWTSESRPVFGVAHSCIFIWFHIISHILILIKFYVKVLVNLVHKIQTMKLKSPDNIFFANIPTGPIVILKVSSNNLSLISPVNDSLECDYKIFSDFNPLGKVCVIICTISVGENKCLNNSHLAQHRPLGGLWRPLVVEINRVQSYTLWLARAVWAPCNHMNTLRYNI